MIGCSIMANSIILLNLHCSSADNWWAVMCTTSWHTIYLQICSSGSCHIICIILLACLWVGADEKHPIISSFISSFDKSTLSPDSTESTWSLVQYISACLSLKFLPDSKHANSTLLGLTRNDIFQDLSCCIL